MKTKLMYSKDESQSCIEVGNDEIKEVKEYLYLGWMVNNCRDMNVEITSVQKVFTTIKDLLKAKLDKILHANLFSGTI